MRRRLPAVLAAALALTLLAACRTHVGAAAFVAHTRISESDVRQYVDPHGPSAQALAQAQQSGGTLNARTEATSILVTDLVFREVLSQRNLLPNAAALRQLHDPALAFFGAQSGGAQIDATLSTSLQANGLKPTLLPKLLDNYELEYVLIQKINAQTLAELSKAVAAANVPISVSPAYGTWDPANVRVGSAPLPAFLNTKLTYTPGAPSSSPSATG